MESNNKYETFIKEKRALFLKEVDSPDWTSEKRTKQYELFLRQGETSKTVKVVGTFNGSPSKLKAFLLDPTTLTKYDDSKESRELIEEGPDYRIFFTKGIKMWLVDPRDVLQLQAFEEKSDGTIILSGGSLEAHEKVPGEIKGRVRAWAEVTGYILEPVEGDPNKTKFTFCGKLDPKGSVPAMVVNKIMMKQGDIQEKINTVIGSYEAKGKL